MGGVSVVSAQTNDATQPTTVQPRNRFKANIALALRFLAPMIVGKKYSAPNTQISRIPIRFQESYHIFLLALAGKQI